jgi:hypothetical protein
MRLRLVWITAVLFVVATLPAGAAVNKNGAGLSAVAGVLDCESCSDTFDFSGYAVFGKIGLDDHWSLYVTFRDMEDDELFLFNEEDSYTQLSVQAAYTWRVSRAFRPYVKFGVTRTDFEAEAPPLPALEDDGVSLAVGGGFEAGSQRVAFLLDYDFTTVELFDEDFDIGNLGLGILFKF